jgi:hypothetical protein
MHTSSTFLGTVKYAAHSYALAMWAEGPGDRAAYFIWMASKICGKESVLSRG